MKPVIFAGPTLSGDPALASGDFSWLPPAAEGDVYRLARRRPPAIGLIDGQFEAMPSVWHKEILWALSRGIAVYGAASMGALRAAELERFGMVGVGAIFRDYRAGRLNRDDEVAVVHAPGELGYRPMSEALVNIRATLAAAVRARAISAAGAAQLLAIAGAQFFKERSWPVLIAAARRGRVKGLSRLEAFLAHGRVDRKRRDALAMLARIRRDHARKPRAPDFAFQHTIYWQDLVERNL